MMRTSRIGEQISNRKQTNYGNFHNNPLNLSAYAFGGSSSIKNSHLKNIFTMNDFHNDNVGEGEDPSSPKNIRGDN